MVFCCIGFLSIILNHCKETQIILYFVSTKKTQKSKTSRKRKSRTWGAASGALCLGVSLGIIFPQAPCAWHQVKTCFLLFFKLDRWKKPSFLDLNPKQPDAINRTLAHCFIHLETLTIQRKGQTSEIQGIISPPFILARVCFSCVLLWCLLPWANKPLDYGSMMNPFLFVGIY